MQSDKRTQMGKYEFSILLREGESLLLILREWHRRHERPLSQNCKQTVNIHNIY